MPVYTIFIYRNCDKAFEEYKRLKEKYRSLNMDFKWETGSATCATIYISYRKYKRNAVRYINNIMNRLAEVTDSCIGYIRFPSTISGDICPQ